ncbi:hypothetical protein EYC80_003449 [Monilinia laxa]|uniref:Uncharacterized protein n=1 Tax=Monilinia laxa TaxID=61186 RepID=A0A5N6KE15_MONLA|nr:hypothetical protein EYC80_003449 [Monilinia laxa]
MKRTINTTLLIFKDATVRGIEAQAMDVVQFGSFVVDDQLSVGEKGQTLADDVTAEPGDFGRCVVILEA